MYLKRVGLILFSRLSLGLRESCSIADAVYESPYLGELLGLKSLKFAIN